MKQALCWNSLKQRRLRTKNCLSGVPYFRLHEFASLRDYCARSDSNWNHNLMDRLHSAYRFGGQGASPMA